MKTTENLIQDFKGEFETRLCAAEVAQTQQAPTAPMEMGEVTNKVQEKVAPIKKNLADMAKSTPRGALERWKGWTA